MIKLLFFYTDELIKRNAHIFNYFPFGHRVVGSSSNYGFWLPLWYLQTLLNRITFVFTSFLFWINRTTYTLSEAGTVKKNPTFLKQYRHWITLCVVESIIHRREMVHICLKIKRIYCQRVRERSRFTEWHHKIIFRSCASYRNKNVKTITNLISV